MRVKVSMLIKEGKGKKLEYRSRFIQERNFSEYGMNNWSIDLDIYG
jgi:hypothetical protein